MHQKSGCWRIACDKHVAVLHMLQIVELCVPTFPLPMHNLILDLPAPRPSVCVTTGIAALHLRQDHPLMQPGRIARPGHYGAIGSTVVNHAPPIQTCVTT